MSKMDDRGEDKLLKAIKHYQDSVVRHSKTSNEAKVLHAIKKLNDMPITVAHLQDTGVGKTINALRKHEGEVGQASRTIIAKWKSMVAKDDDVEDTIAYGKEPEVIPIQSEKKHKSRSNHSSENSDSEVKQQKTKENKCNEEKSNNKKHKHHSDSSSRHKNHKHSEKNSSHRSSSHSNSLEEKKHKKHEEKEPFKERDKHDKKRKHSDDVASSSKRRYNNYESEEEKYSDENNRSSPEKDILLSEQESDYKEKSPEPQKHSKHKRERSCEEKSPVREKKHKSHKSSHHKSEKHDKHRSHSKETQNGHSSKSNISKTDKTESKSHRQTDIKIESKSSNKIDSKSDKQESKTDSKDSKSSSKSSNKSSHKDKEELPKIKKEKAEKCDTKKPESSKSDSSKNNKQKSKSAAKPSSDRMKKEPNSDDDGIDCESGASFAEALGMFGTIPTIRSVPVKKKTASPTPSTSKSSKTSRLVSSPLISSPLGQSPNLLTSNIKLEPLDLNLPAALPEITTNYKPLPSYHDFDSTAFGLRPMTEEEALEVVITSKTQRTKVYSGNKTWKSVPSLFNLCVKVLQDNIDSLEYTGGVPYSILKPVLDKASADQLFNAENHNPYLVEETDELWELHCKKIFRGKNPQDHESWRDMYLRCCDEREAKLRSLTQTIKQSQDVKIPVRQTKLAYVDSVVKPPRGIARKQAKYGTSKGTPMVTPTSRLNAVSSPKTANAISVPNPVRVASTSGGIIKPKKAPLMQKALAAIKSRYRR